MGKSYTATERRGVLAIAIIALLLIGAGVGISYFKGESLQKTPTVVELPEMIDSTTNEDTQKEVSISDRKNKPATNRKKKQTSTKKSAKDGAKKTYRKRSPNDEPV